MTKKLEMVFALDSGKSVTIALADPRDDLTKAEATAVMLDIIAKDAFVNKAGKLAAVKAVNVRMNDSVALA